MKIKVKKLHPDAFLPTYGSLGAAAFDIYSIEQTTIMPGQTLAIDTGLGFELDPGYYLEIRPRSGLSLNTKIRIANSPGTVDFDFKGSVKIIVDNLLGQFPEKYIIKKGERIAQALLKKYDQVEFEEVQELSETERGEKGYGSTGA